MIWIAINVALSSVVGGIVAVKLALWHARFNLVERVGMGLLGAGCVMTIGPILAPHSPFENWAGSLFRLGCAIYFCGRMLRHRMEARRVDADNISSNTNRLEALENRE